MGSRRDSLLVGIILPPAAPIRQPAEPESDRRSSGRQRIDPVPDRPTLAQSLRFRHAGLSQPGCSLPEAQTQQLSLWLSKVAQFGRLGIGITN
jgi:hypothetical protein